MKITKFKIVGLPKDTEFAKMPWGRQIEWLRKIQEFKDSAKSVHLSQKRQSYTKAIREFVKLNEVKEYYCSFHAGRDYYDDTFQIWYR